MTTLCIEDWRAWCSAPLDVPPDFRLNIAEKPSAPILPLMLRRRLDPMGRAVCQTLADLKLPPEAPLIYVSRHGTMSITQKILESIIEELPVSPTQFSLSVHNAIIGIYSIAAQHHGPIQALAAGGEELDALFTEARGYLMEGHPVVGVVFAEKPLDEPLTELVESPRAAACAALRLTLVPDAHHTNEPQGSGQLLIATSSDAAMPNSATDPIALIHFLLGLYPTIGHRKQWKWAEIT